jgi:preprotein translocase subunit SecG
MYQFLLVVHVIVAAIMVGVILMQRSEGGGLTGGSPSGLMSARGAADFLTRATTILAILFVGISIALAAIATVTRAPSTIDTSLARKPGVGAAATPATTGDDAAANMASTNSASPAVNSPVPLAVPTTGAAPVANITRETPKPVKPKPVATRPAASNVSAPAVSTPAVTNAAPKPADAPVVVPPGLVPPANSN